MTDIPVTHHWLAGDEMNADRMNEVRDAIEFLRNPPAVHVRRRLTAQTGITGTWTKILFDQVVYDPYGMFDSGNSDRITATIPGWYTYEGVISLNPTSTSCRVLLGVFRNGLTDDEHLLRYDVDNAPSAGNVDIRKESTIFLNVGDFLHLAVNHGCAAETRTSQISSDAQSSQLRVRWISK
jgi:hypothetical protein